MIRSALLERHRRAARRYADPQRLAGADRRCAATRASNRRQLRRAGSAASPRAYFGNSGGAVTGFNCFITPHPEEREWSMFDPCAQAIWRFLDTRQPLEPGQLVTVDRFWMDIDAYQSLSPTQGMIFVAATRYVLTTPDLAYTFYVWKDADMWRMAAEQVLFERVSEVDFVVGQHTHCVFMRDWLALPTTAWLEALAERETT